MTKVDLTVKLIFCLIKKHMILMKVLSFFTTVTLQNVSGRLEEQLTVITVTESFVMFYLCFKSFVCCRSSLVFVCICGP